MDGAEVSICIGAQRFGKFGVSEQWPWFSYLPCGSWYGSWDVDFCGAVPLIPQSTSAQVTSALGAIELMELQGQLKCFAELRSVQPAPVLWARETCSEIVQWVRRTGRTEPEGWIPAFPLFSVWTKSGCNRKLLLRWGWKLVEDLCKLFSASLIGTLRVVVEFLFQVTEFTCSTVRYYH